MTAEEIMHALRQCAMGRVNTPEQQRLCEALGRVFDEVRALQAKSAPGDELRVSALVGDVTLDAADAEAMSDAELAAEVVNQIAAPKRTRKKAD